MAARFIICSHARIGSYMLATALDAHPDLRVAGEVFLDPRPFGLPDVRCITPLTLSDQPSRDESSRYIGALTSANFIEEAFRRYDGIIASRLLLSSWEYLLDRLQTDVRIILMDRRNLLRAFCSLKIGLKDNSWHVGDRKASLMLDHPTTRADYDPQKQGTVRVEPSALRSYLSEYEQLLRTFREKLRAYPLMDVVYEDLCADLDATMSRVQAFLGVEVRALVPATRKQETRPLREVIENYDEVFGVTAQIDRQ